jgi:hypothetical protein
MIEWIDSKVQMVIDIFNSIFDAEWMDEEIW